MQRIGDGLSTMFEKYVGARDPKTLSASANYAVFLGESGEAHAARDLMVKLVPVFESTFGVESSYDLNTRHTLGAQSRAARFTGEAGDPMAAVDQLSVLAKTLEATLGPYNLDTLEVLLNMAHWMGEYDPAAALQQFTRLEKMSRGSGRYLHEVATTELGYWTAVTARRRIHGRAVATGAARTTADIAADDEFVLAWNVAVIYDKTGLTERVVQTGDADALYQLGVLLNQREPSQPAYAQILYREAAAAGNRDATCRVDDQAEH